MRASALRRAADQHLAALLALSPGTPPLRGAVAWYAPSDLARQGDGASSPEALLLGAAPADVPDLAREASPVAQVRPGAPPFLLVHGEEDSMVDCDHSRRLAARLGEAGTEVDLCTVPGAEHVWHGLSDDQVHDVFGRTLRWIQQRVG
ncbi:prolyl oligopeptidase family serine peptidase [Streptomyces sp. NPDC014995]|uniref:prolyl oligopeptidase family serine peptidase n=1 Tax=Streptomyces sp. NPDC014995 TaxID=3364936 RepID=UPI0036FC76F1